MDKQTVEYFHSVRLIEEECKGCTHCIRTCPTEAIRVRHGKARIIEERCIDCGECIRTCPNSAKITVTDSLEILKEFKHKIAIPAPSLTGQFSSKHTATGMLSGFLHMGFDDVLEVGFGAGLLSRAITEYLRGAGSKIPRPVISSACPAVVRLIQVRYSGLVENILPMQSPMEVTARYVKERAAEATGLDEKEIGVFFISPCPAKVTVVKQPIGAERSYVDGVIAAKDAVNYIRKNFDDIEGRNGIQKAGGSGISWGRRGGEVASIGIPRKLSVDGIHHVRKILDKVEEGGLKKINLIEAQACVGGCVGGVLMAEDPFLAKVKIDIVSEEIGAKNDAQLDEAYGGVKKEMFFLDGKVGPRPITPLDTNVDEAMKKLKAIEWLCGVLPGSDCGSCGCPTCRAFAEDVVMGLSTPLDCQFKMREQVGGLVAEIHELLKKLPHTEWKRGAENEDI
ncbi:MAG TPA: [Fe-Fe] hydrogenase large subunit C-terminal domain-containing protein [bacterium]|nr:[Fe-Fe] hydrogenase large subunit C-terminal domain-containing protein [bacterium]HPN93582.1 [Fe-Fe] hydrogenase large subunit C-terminal domain-containing protein [bacterium]